jgi:lipopolysaccharide transport system ATP-binding protein
MNNIALRVDQIGKRFRIGERQKYKALRDTLTNYLYAPIRAVTSLLKGNKSGKVDLSFIWALKDVSFEIQSGTAVGLIGSNGAGKSTLLKILSRIIEPTEGFAQIHGRVGSLLEVGTGFHPELTGRENIYLNGAILGMRRNEIKQKFDEIVDFAEVEKFIDTPIKHYSSGMHVRLAFAVAAHLQPEILLVDEVLAVGDAAFQKKCIGKMGEVKGEGRTVLFVSHNMSAVRFLCDRAILIEQGHVLLDGDPSEVIGTYLSSGISQESGGEIVWASDDEAPGGQELKLRAIRLIDPEGRVKSTFQVDKPIQIEICYEVKRVLRDMRIRMGLLTLQGEIAFETTDHDLREEDVLPGLYKSICTIPGSLLNVGEYLIRVSGGIPGVRVLLPMKEYLSISTVGPGSQGTFHHRRWPGVVCPKLDWVIERMA